MQIFLDSANYREIEHWFQQGVIDGVTTNPSIMLKDGVYDIEECTQRLCALLGNRPVSVEVTTNDPAEMLRQGRTLAHLAPNAVAKIPVVNEDGESCLGVIHTLSCEGVSVNATAILSFNQAILAAKAGANYLSVFAGRIADEGNDPSTVIQHLRRWLDEWGYQAKILVGSVRAVIDVQKAAIAGAHIVTIPPQFLPKMVDHKYSRETVRQFNQDAEKAMAQITQVKVAH